MRKIGIITYHSAYNFGSVLQALATQYSIKKLGNDSIIINYRMKSQYNFYRIKNKKGIKSTLKKILYGFDYFKLISREKRFEDFISNYLTLSKEVSKPEEVYSLYKPFDIMISGSDQIWNKHSNELKNMDWEYMNPYLLAEFKGKKISYASSIVNMTEQDLQYLKPYLKKFEHISCREQDAAEKISDLVKRKIENVCDPTFLLKKEEWEEFFDKERMIADDYILVYTLASFKNANKLIKEIKTKFKGKRIIVLSPLSPIINRIGVKTVYDAGPKEFLNLVYNAKYVITDSYHGMMFAVNFNVDFYYFKHSGKNEVRVYNVLKILGIEDRILSSIDKMNMESQIDYKKVSKNGKDFRDKSIHYLRNALSEGME